MQDQVKDIVLTGDQNGLELNSKYVKETIVEYELGIWGPKKKLHLQTCKMASSTKKSNTAEDVVVLRDDRAFFTSFLILVLCSLRLTSKEALANSSWLHFQESYSVRMVSLSVRKTP